MAAKQSWAESRGIAAKWHGTCPLCGGAIEVGERIFKLPVGRSGNVTTWVCWTCRWPSSAGTPTANSIHRKLQHRLAQHKSPSINKGEAAVLAELLERAVNEGSFPQGSATLARVAELRDLLREAVDWREPANLGHEHALIAVIAIDELVRIGAVSVIARTLDGPHP